MSRVCIWYHSSEIETAINLEDDSEEAVGEAIRSARPSYNKSQL